MSAPGQSAARPAATPAPLAPSGGAVAPAAAAVELSAPLTDDAIAKLVSSTTPSSVDSYGIAVDKLKAIQNIPACQPMYGRGVVDPVRCMEQRRNMRDANRAESIDSGVRPLAPLVRSLELEFPLLPQDPLQAIAAVDRLRAKYFPLLRWAPYLRSKDPQPMSEDTRDLLRQATRLEDRLTQQRRASVNDPSVRQAFVEGRLSESQVKLELPLKDLIEWRADAESWRIAQSLRGTGRKLFMDRTSELDRSTREATQASHWSTWGEPTDTEIGLALLRVLAIQGGQLTKPFESESGAIFGHGVIRIIDVNKLGCRRKGDGFVCDTQLWMQMFYRGLVAEVLHEAGGHPAAMLIHGLQQTIRDRNGVTVSHVFRATPNGWMAPDIGSKGATRPGEADVFGAMQEAGRKATCRSAAGEKGSAAEWARGLNDC